MVAVLMALIFIQEKVRAWAGSKRANGRQENTSTPSDNQTMSLIPTVQDPASPAAARLIELCDACMAALYPPQSNHLESIQALKQPNVYFIGIESGGKLLACGATKILNDDGHYGEIKRVFVVDEARGHGLSKIIMTALEDHLRMAGVRLARLETGIKQPEALGLYRKLGYAVRGPFGSYQPDPLSVFMEKSLWQPVSATCRNLL